MMGKRNGILQLLKKDHPAMIVVHCVIHRENLVAKNLSPELNVIMSAVIKVINHIKANYKTERLFKSFCKDAEEEYIRLLSHTEVRWLSKGRCLERFVALYDAILEFCGDDITESLHAEDAKAKILYLTDIFGKLNALNRDLQGANKTIMESKSKIFGFVSKLEMWRRELGLKEFANFSHLQQCTVHDRVLEVIVDHISMLITDFQARFVDLQKMVFPDWLTQPFLCQLSDADRAVQDELAQMKHDESVKVLHKVKNVMMWLTDEIGQNYPIMSAIAKKMLLPFPTSYLVEYGFSAVVDILTKKRNRLDICERGDLRIKLTKLQP